MTAKSFLYYLALVLIWVVVLLLWPIFQLPRLSWAVRSLWSSAVDSVRFHLVHRPVLKQDEIERENLAREKARLAESRLRRRKVWMTLDSTLEVVLEYHAFTNTCRRQFRVDICASEERAARLELDQKSWEPVGTDPSIRHRVEFPTSFWKLRLFLFRLGFRKMTKEELDRLAASGFDLGRPPQEFRVIMNADGSHAIGDRR